jgi:hypothetical protein
VIAYRVDQSVGCTTSVWDGNIGPGDIQQHLLVLAADREWPPGPLHLTDLTTITRADIPDPELLDLLYEGTNLSEDLKVAVVVRPEFLRSSDPQFTSAAAEMRATTFTDLDPACAYLGIDPAATRATISEIRAELQQRSA